MKKQLLSKIITLIYLLCCLAIIVIPNDIGEKVKTGGLTQKTHLPVASEEKRKDFENVLLDLGDRAAKQYEGLTSILILKDGEIYFEEYYNGNTEETLFEIHSCTKTIIALLAGIAQEQGILPSEDEPYMDLFKGLEIPYVTQGFEGILIRNMLTMSSGIHWDRYEESVKVKKDIVINGLDYGLNTIPGVELLDKPGEHFYYNSNESRSLMALIAYRADMEDIEFANKYLFNKLEIQDQIWPYNDSGLLPGGKDLYLCSRDLAKIGQLLLDEGKYKEEQVVPREWVQKMLTPSLKSVESEDIKPSDILNYGYYIWHTQYKEYDINFAYGRGGQYVFIVPELDICVVTSAIDKVRSEHFRDILYDVIDLFEGEMINEKIHQVY